MLKVLIGARASVFADGMSTFDPVDPPGELGSEIVPYVVATWRTWRRRKAVVRSSSSVTVLSLRQPWPSPS
jgi:hypothetical protein